MRIVIFSPGLDRSSIGQGAAGACREMVAAGEDVNVVITEHPKYFGLGLHRFDCPLTDWVNEADVERLISQADACIFHIGNNYDFHVGALRWLEKGKGLVCLHDFFLGHLFYEAAGDQRGQAERILSYWYGEDASRSYFQHQSSQAFIAETRDLAPMTEWLCSQARAVITHSHWGADRVLRSCPGPVAVVPLVFDLPEALRGLPPNERMREDRLNLLTIGHMNLNKRLDKVIEAIGADPGLRRQVRYRLIGPIEDHVRNLLETQAASLGVKLEISGAVETSGLVEALTEAHVVSCLRHPTLEAASGSAIEAMMSGRPLLVTNAGFYAEIPDEFVLKIGVENEVQQLRDALRWIAAKPDLAVDMASKAQAWACETFTARNYAEQCRSVAEAMLRTNPVLDASLIHQAQFRTWGGSGGGIRSDQLP